MLFWICQEPSGPYLFLNIQELRGEAYLSWGCISHYSDKYPLPFYEPYGKRWLFATLSLIGIFLCFVNLEFSSLSLLRITTVYMPTPCWLKHLCSIRALIPVSFFLFFFLLSLYFWLIPWGTAAGWAHFLAQASKTLSRRRPVPSPTWEGAWCLRAAAPALRTGLYWLSA